MHCFDPLYGPSQHENEEATAPFNVHTTYNVTMSGFLTIQFEVGLPHYLI